MKVRTRTDPDAVVGELEAAEVLLERARRRLGLALERVEETRRRGGSEVLEALRVATDARAELATANAAARRARERTAARGR